MTIKIQKVSLNGCGCAARYGYVKRKTTDPDEIA